MYCILIVSSYSENSRKLLEQIQNTPINIAEIKKINVVYIDNKEIRQQVIKDLKFNISVVPSLLIIQPDGIAQKLEGYQIKNWVEETVRENSHQYIQPQIIPDEIEEIEEIKEIEKKPRRKKPRNTKQTVKQTVKQSRNTNVNDLLNLDESDESDEYDVSSYSDNEEYFNDNLNKPPPASLGANGELTDAFGEIEQPNRDARHLVKSKIENAIDTKGSDIASAVAKMQKERNMTDELQTKPNK
jgi:hypothetical protein